MGEEGDVAPPSSQGTEPTEDPGYAPEGPDPEYRWEGEIEPWLNEVEEAYAEGQITEDEYRYYLATQWVWVNYHFETGEVLEVKIDWEAINIIREHRPDLDPYLPQEPQAQTSDPQAKSTDLSNTIYNEGQGLTPVDGNSKHPYPASQSQQSQSSPREGESMQEPPNWDRLPNLSEESKTRGDPVVLFSGQFYHQATDLFVRGRGINFAFVRTYMNQTVYKGPLGHNWDHSYNLWLREAQRRLPDGTLQNILVRSTGQMREDVYVQITELTNEISPLAEFSDAIFQPPLGFFDRLEKYNGKYILETVTGVRFEYNNDLYIEKITDKNGNIMNFEYTDHLLTKVTDPVGKEFLFKYDEMNRVTTLLDKIGNRTITYNYGDNGDLEEVDFFMEPDLIAGIDYRYLGPCYPIQLQHNLIEIINPLGKTIVQNEYGIQPNTMEYNHIVRQFSDSGEYRYEYKKPPNILVDPTAKPNAVPHIVTTVYYPNENYIDYWCNADGNIIKKVENLIVGGLAQEIETNYKYNQDALIVEELRADGSAFEYEYEREYYANSHGGDVKGASPLDRQKFGNLRRLIEIPTPSLGEDRRIVTEYNYTSLDRLSEQRGPYYSDSMLNPIPNQPVYFVNYGYDAKGNLESVSFGDVVSPDGTTKTLFSPSFSYNEYGLLKEFHVPSGHYELIYHDDIMKSGFVQKSIEHVDGNQLTTKYDVDDLGRITRIENYLGTAVEVVWTTFDTPMKISFPETLAGTEKPTTHYEYNRNRDLVKVLEEIKLHDGQNHPDSPLITKFSYDSYSRVTKKEIHSNKESDVRIHKLIYNSQGIVEREIDACDNVTFYRYNERMQISKITKGWMTSSESTCKLTYDLLSRLIEYTNGRGFKSFIQYDAFGRPHIIVDADGNELIQEYDAAGNIINQKKYGPHPDTHAKMRWEEQEFRYDSMGRMIERLDHLFIPLSSDFDTFDQILPTQYFYDSRNRIEKIINSEGNTIKYDYYDRNRIKSINDSGGNQIHLHYDDIGNKLLVMEKDTGIDDFGNPITEFFKRETIFDARGHPIEEVDGLGNITKHYYDSRGHRTCSMIAQNNKLFMDYDIFGNLCTTRKQLGNEEIRTELIYNKNDDVEKIVSPINGETIILYDSLNRIKIISMGTTITNYQYDKDGNIELEKYSNGVVVSKSYTPAGFLEASVPDVSGFKLIANNPDYIPFPTSSSKFQFNALGGLSLAKNDVATVTFRYDSLGRVINEKMNNNEVSYRYNDRHTITGLTYPNGRDISYEYTHLGLVKRVMQNKKGSSYPGDSSLADSRVLVDTSYIGARRLYVKYDMGHIERFYYDPNKRKIGSDCISSSDSTNLSLQRTLFGSLGNLVINQLNNTIRIYKYDDILRLLKCLEYEGASPIDIISLTPAKTLEGLSNGVSQSNITSTISSVENQLSNLTPLREYEYIIDKNTNRLQTKEMITPGEPSTLTNYATNLEDQYTSIRNIPILYDNAGNTITDLKNNYRFNAYNLISEIDSGMEISTILHDALGRPISFKKNGIMHDLIYAGTKLIEWRKNGTIEGQAVPLRDPHQYAHVAADGIDASPILDIDNSVISWVTKNATIFSSLLYDPFGQVISQTNDFSAPFRYRGYVYDDSSGLYHLAARSYQPTLGRFLQKDPAGFVDGTNLYAYAHHSPTMFTEIWGLDSTSGLNWGNIGRSMTTLAAGVGTAAIGLLLISNPVGWVGLSLAAGAMMFAGGIASIGGGLVQLGTSQTVSENENRRLDEALSVSRSISSPGGLVGGTTAVAVGGDIETGAAIGSIAEGIATMGPGIYSLYNSKLAVSLKSGGVSAGASKVFSYKYGNIPDMGTTNKYGEVTIKQGLSAVDEWLTVRHEYGHFLLTPKNPYSGVGLARAEAGMWTYQNSELVRFTEELWAESYATHKFIHSAKFAYQGYVDVPAALAAEAFVYYSIAIEPVIYAATADIDPQF